MRIAVSNKNVIGRVTFGKIAKVGSISLESLSNVDAASKQEGDVLVYQSNTNTYVIKTLPKIDCGTF